ncbi:MAG TPA: BTAD domain-containing putative transcriptional regulator [Streptomyces sp.]
MSELLEALWGGGTEPRTARRILQNAVWRLRGILPEGSQQGDSADLRSAGAPSWPKLLTREPGYILEVDLGDVDLYRFRNRAASGREALAKGDAVAASVILREALDLWRGPVLADLAEAGIAWPDLVATQNSRLDALDDYFQAELACGRHHAIVGELEKLLESHPLREATCAQLMLALYRSGRQVDALNLYEQVRCDLVENLGVDPGLKLRDLQRAILNHDPSLAATTAAPGPVIIRRPETVPAPYAPLMVTHTAGPSPAPAFQPRPAAAVSRSVSHLLICVHPVHEDNRAYGEADVRADAVDAQIQEVIDYYGGRYIMRGGMCSTVLFGLQRSTDRDATRAVLAALAVQDRLGEREDLVVKLAVTRGQIHTEPSPETHCTLPNGTGVLVDQAHALLTGMNGPGLRVCGETRRAAMGLFRFLSADGLPGAWDVNGTYGDYLAVCADLAAQDEPGPFVDRDHELGLLSQALERAHGRGLPHLVTVVGQAKVGKTRLLTEFEKQVKARGTKPAARFVNVADGPSSAWWAGAGLPERILAEYCGVGPEEGPDQARSALAAACRTLRYSHSRWKELYESLLPLLVPRAGDPARARATQRDVLPALREFLVAASRVAPLVIMVDDADDLDETEFGLLKALTEDRVEGPVPLLVVVAASPGLLTRYPGHVSDTGHINWSGVSLAPRRSVCAAVR